MHAKRMEISPNPKIKRRSYYWELSCQKSFEFKVSLKEL